MSSPRVTKVNKETQFFSILFHNVGLTGNLVNWGLIQQGARHFHNLQCNNHPNKADRTAIGVMSVLMWLAELGLRGHRDSDGFSRGVCGFSST